MCWHQSNYASIIKGCWSNYNANRKILDALWVEAQEKKTPATLNEFWLEINENDMHVNMLVNRRELCSVHIFKLTDISIGFICQL